MAVFFNSMLMNGGTTPVDPYWNSVSHLLHLDGANGGTTFTDEKLYAWTRTGATSVTSTAQFKFGSASLTSGTPAINQFISTTNSDVDRLGTGDFTIEYWLYPTNNTTNSDIVSMTNYTTTAQWGVELNNATFANKQSWWVSSNTRILTEATPNTLNVWQHYAWVRASGVLSLYRDGIQQGSAALSNNFNDTSNAFKIGGNSVSGTASLPGYIDEVRVTKGVARYSGTDTGNPNFTVPAASFIKGLKTYAVWNPTDTSASDTFSNNNLTVTVPASGAMTRSTVGKSSGKWYWEYTVGGSTDGPIGGIANASASLAQYTGSNVNSWGYYGFNGLKYTNATGAAYGSAFGIGAVIGVALDMDAGTITFYLNGVNKGVAYSGLSGAMYASYSGSGSNGGSAVANFGASAFAYTVPSGFNSGLYI